MKCFGIFGDATAGPIINTSTYYYYTPICCILQYRKGTPMKTLRNLAINLKVGQEILVGQNDNKAKITKIEYHQKSGDVMINTTRGPRKALSFKLLEEEFACPADRYR